jgi:hypothetical protein
MAAVVKAALKLPNEHRGFFDEPFPEFSHSRSGIIRTLLEG